VAGNAAEKARNKKNQEKESKVKNKKIKKGKKQIGRIRLYFSTLPMVIV